GSPVIPLPVRYQAVLAVPARLTVAIPAPGCRDGSAGRSRNMPASHRRRDERRRGACMIPRRDPPATPKRLSRHPLWLAAAAVAVALAAAACGGSSSSGGGEVKEGGVFRLGSNSTIDSLNPFVAFNADAYSTFEYIYPMLVQYNPKLQFIPDF